MERDQYGVFDTPGASGTSMTLDPVGGGTQLELSPQPSEPFPPAASGNWVVYSELPQAGSSELAAYDLFAPLPSAPFYSSTNNTYDWFPAIDGTLVAWEGGAHRAPLASEVA